MGKLSLLQIDIFYYYFPMFTFLVNLQKKAYS